MINFSSNVALSPEMIDSIVLTFYFHIPDISSLLLSELGFPPLWRDASMTIRGALSLIALPGRCNSAGRIEREYILFNKRSSVNLYSLALRKSVTSRFRSKTSFTRAQCISAAFIIKIVVMV